MVNRAKSRQHRQYTVAHELGHHVLHLNSSYDPNQLGFSTKNLAELQAHMFAYSLVIWVTKGQEREDVLRQNPEALAIVALSLFMSLTIIVIPLLVHFWSRLFPPQLPGSIERK